MRVSQSIRKHRLIMCRVVSLVLAAVICGTATELVSAEELERNPPEFKLSLREAIQATIDNNVNVRLLKERIASAQSQANTSLGVLLPNVGGYLNGRNQTVNLAAFGLPLNRLAGLGLVAATIATNQAQVMLMTILVVALMINLSGTWTPPEAMPVFLARSHAAVAALSFRHHQLRHSAEKRGARYPLAVNPIHAGLGGSLLSFGLWRFWRQYR